MIIYKWIETPLGNMMGAAHEGKICFLEFSDRKNMEKQLKTLEKYYGEEKKEGACDVLDSLKSQINQYFKGNLTRFDLPLSFRGTAFQEKTWTELLTIPYGATRTYGEQAKAMNKPLAVRAVANSNGKNRIAIIIPCHRIIGANGKLTGYAGGLERKAKLLELESVHKK